MLVCHIISVAGPKTCYSQSVCVCMCVHVLPDSVFGCPYGKIAASKVAPLKRCNYRANMKNQGRLDVDMLDKAAT